MKIRVLGLHLSPLHLGAVEQFEEESVEEKKRRIEKLER